MKVNFDNQSQTLIGKNSQVKKSPNFNGRILINADDVLAFDSYLARNGKKSLKEVEPAFSVLNEAISSLTGFSLKFEAKTKDGAKNVISVVSDIDGKVKASFGEVVKGEKLDNPKAYLELGKYLPKLPRSLREALRKLPLNMQAGYVKAEKLEEKSVLNSKKYE